MHECIILNSHQKYDAMNSIDEKIFHIFIIIIERNQIVCLHIIYAFENVETCVYNICSYMNTNVFCMRNLLQEKRATKIVMLRNKTHFNV